jgi:broad specificity phosphatase PhoE
MDATQLLVIRHGQSEWNAVGRWQGHADPPLSELGRRQAFLAAASIGAVDAIVSSDLLRAAETAAIIAQQLGVGPVVVDERLRERDAGEWTGLTHSEIEDRWPGWIEGKKRPNGFEAVDSVVDRALASFASLQAASPGGSVLVITHGGVIRALEKLHGRSGNAIANLGGITVRATPSGHSIGERVALLDAGEVAITHNEEL